MPSHGLLHGLVQNGQSQERGQKLPVGMFEESDSITLILVEIFPSLLSHSDAVTRFDERGDSAKAGRASEEWPTFVPITTCQPGLSDDVEGPRVRRTICLISAISQCAR